MAEKTECKLLDIEFYIEVAQEHGEDSEPDHEVGDLQLFVREMWSLLTPEQKAAFARNHHVLDTINPFVRDLQGELDKLP